MDFKRAVRIQQRLSEKIVFEWAGGKVRTVGGADCAQNVQGDMIGASVVVFSFPELEVIEISSAVQRVALPYVPGFLAFREGPVFFEAYRKLHRKPDVTLLDGNGIAHPRRMGLASYVGVILDIPTVGCAKTAFFPFCQPLESRGSFSIFRDKTKEKVGFCLRTRSGVKPLFVSPGHKIDFARAKQLVLACSTFRIPEPLREAHRQAKNLLRP
jgi:deoxyribonuclease V